MHWVAPTAKDQATETLEKRLWDAPDQFRANSGLKPQEYSGPIIGLIILRFGEVRFAVQSAKLKSTGASSRRSPRVHEPATLHVEDRQGLRDPVGPSRTLPFRRRRTNNAILSRDETVAIRKRDEHQTPSEDTEYGQ